MAEGHDKTKFRDQASQRSRQETSREMLYSRTSSSRSRETSMDSQYSEWHQISEYDQACQTSHQDTSGVILYSRTSTSRETGEDSQHLEWHQIREYDLVKHGRASEKQNVDPNGAKCDNKKCIISLSGKIALYLCYVCNLLLCGECMLKHDKTHEFVSVESETDERRRMAEMFVGRMRSERLRRGIDFDREDVRAHGRVNVKHELYEFVCYITGISGLGNKRWVAVDRFNYCIKLFCSVSNTLLRYIKFGSQPFGATEIKVKQKSTDPDSVSGSKTDISVPAPDELDKQSFLAVTFPDIKQIWFIDVSKTKAVKTKTIKMDKKCFSIDFSEDQIFSLCQDYDEFIYYHFIYILSKDGNQLKVIHDPRLFTAKGTPGTRLVDFGDLNVHNGRVYYNNEFNERVSCINVEDGKTISELTLEGSMPRGISVDQNTGVVYVCGWRHNKVFKLSPDLREYEPFSLDTDYTEGPTKLCFINNKLYISHLWSSSLQNVVTVVQLLT